jgi:hypothetical protein
MVFNATFNNISYIVAISFIGGENHRPVASHWHILPHNVVYQVHLATSDKCNPTGATSGTGTAYPPEITSFQWVRVVHLFNYMYSRFLFRVVMLLWFPYKKDLGFVVTHFCFVGSSCFIYFHIRWCSSNSNMPGATNETGTGNPSGEPMDADDLLFNNS